MIPSCQSHVNYMIPSCQSHVNPIPLLTPPVCVLWQEAGSFQKVSVISQEEFENRTPKYPSDPKQEVPVIPRSVEVQELAEPASGPQSPRDQQPRTPKTPRTPGRLDPNKTPRFYPVIKESAGVDGQTPRKKKTRHSSNPPQEQHIGWVMDSQEHRARSASV
ncbi:hypothetical protein CRUP_019696, partial [Coryphaenoides rupestris]